METITLRSLSEKTGIELTLPENICPMRQKQLRKGSEITADELISLALHLNISIESLIET